MSESVCSKSLSITHPVNGPVHYIITPPGDQLAQSLADACASVVELCREVNSARQLYESSRPLGTPALTAAEAQAAENRTIASHRAYVHSEVAMSALMQARQELRSIVDQLKRELATPLAEGADTRAARLKRSIASLNLLLALDVLEWMVPKTSAFPSARTDYNKYCENERLVEALIAERSGR